MSMEPHFDITITRTIAAPRRTLFLAWLSPPALRQFMCPAPGVTLAEVAVDPRVGGTFNIVMQVGDKRLPHRGEYTVIERYERLSFTWRSASAGQESQVTLTFAEVSAEKTALTLQHVGLPHRVARDNHERGWTRIVQLLESAELLAGPHVDRQEKSA